MADFPVFDFRFDQTTGMIYDHESPEQEIENFHLWAKKKCRPRVPPPGFNNKRKLLSKKTIERLIRICYKRYPNPEQFGKNLCYGCCKVFEYEDLNELCGVCTRTKDGKPNNLCNDCFDVFDAGGEFIDESGNKIKCCKFCKPIVALKLEKLGYEFDSI